MRHLLQRIRAYWPRFLDGWNLAWGIPVPEDEEPQDDIYYAADYERDLKHDTGEDEFETWIARNQDEEERWG